MSAWSKIQLSQLCGGCGSRPARRCVSVLLGVLLLLASAQAQAPAVTPMVACGSHHTLALSSDGSVRAFGWNINGQLGLGDTTQHPYPQVISNLSSVVSVTAGGTHSLALLSNGTVKAWGSNYARQLGLGDMTMRTTPQAIPNLTSVVALSAGMSHSLALCANGTVKAWGNNDYGQLGLGNWQTQPTIQTIPNLSDVVSVRATGDWSFALLSDGTVKAWGYNTSGVLGFGDTMHRYAPEIIPNLYNVVSIGKGVASESTFAVLADGTVKAWGRNNYGQLGFGDTTYRYVPETIPNLTNVVSVAPGLNHTIALLADGTVKVWGLNLSYQLGLPSTSTQMTPQINPSLSNVTAVSSGYVHGFAVLAGGTSMGWGNNGYGQLGLGYTQPTTPQVIPGLNLCPAMYALEFGSSSSTAVGFTIPCNAEVGALGPGHCYFNAFSVDALNASSPGTGTWYGLHISQAVLLDWLYAGKAGLPLAFGPLGATGGASVSVSIPAAALSGLTFYGVSIAIDPLTNQVVADSNVASHTF